MNFTGFGSDDEDDDSDLDSFEHHLYMPEEEHGDETDSEESEKYFFELKLNDDGVNLHLIQMKK